jgi:hypothetical protein
MELKNEAEASYLNLGGSLKDEPSLLAVGSRHVAGFRGNPEWD